MNDKALLDELAQLVARRIGLRIPDDARDRFAAMLRERAAHLGYSLEDYRTFLAGRQSAEEWERFARAFTSGETFFFRDHGQFDLLRLRLLPELIEQHHHDKTLRLWSAGCASGEEVYSLAMLVDMLLPEHGGWDILILGTDIDSAAIAKARRAQYGKWSFRMVPPGIQQRYFHSDPQSPVKGTPVGSPLLRSDPSAAAIRNRLCWMSASAAWSRSALPISSASRFPIRNCTIWI